MQEDIENKTVTLAISGTKLTGRVLKAAIAKYLAYRKAKKLDKAHADVTPHGKQSVKELIGQNQGVSNIEINNSNIKDFERVARKYGVDFAVKKDKSVTPPKYLVFFKAKDADALTAAFTEYTAKTVKKASRPSVLQKLQKFKDMVKNAVVNRTKRKEHER
ncbi:PcfB family protein [Ruminococcaceae bacterium OttesenSCG-928-L11]|nr:PcfB family protein [Ruminococcaceae bacterium OttesenSCG-928-L11]